jgi:hydroxymethylbilane synthase
MAPVRPVLVGSRSSPLAVAQTDEVLSLLRRRFPDREFSVVPMATLGDKNKEAPLLSMEKGMFVKEIERALLDGEIDLAVHSAKDLTADLPDGLTIRAAGRRQDARDIQVNRWGLRLAELPMGPALEPAAPVAPPRFGLCTRTCG